MTPDEVNDIADAFCDALMSSDYDGLRDLCAPGAMTWSNASGVEQPMLRLLEFLPTLRAGLRQHRYENVRRVVSANGYCEQHHVTVEALDGTVIDLGEVCIVVRLNDEGQVARFDEYIDTLVASKVLPQIRPPGLRPV